MKKLLQIFTVDFFKNLWKFHKKLSILLAIVLVSTIYGSVKIIQNIGVGPKYVLVEAQTGTILQTVAGTGQVAASNQIDLNNNVSGTVLSVNAVTGQQVKAGDLLVTIDPTTARISLENAKISLAKLQEAADPLQLATDQNSLSSSISSKKTSEATGINNVSSSFIDMTNVIDGMNTMFYEKTGYLNSQQVGSMSDVAKSYISTAGVAFDQAKILYTKNLVDSKNVTRDSSSEDIDKIISQTYDTAKALAQSVQYAKIAVDYIKNTDATRANSTDTTTAENNLSSWTTSMNSNVSNLLSSKNSIESSTNNIQQQTLTLQKLQQGTDPLDIRSAELSVETAQNNYNKYFVRAPLDGVVAKISVQVGNQTTGSVGTFISKSKIANISLNEVDVAKVAIGDKTTLNFSAINGLNITGTVAQIDLVGAVSQGVVTYNVQIAFDTDDIRVRPGMSVSASIITSAAQNILLVPSSAVKNQGNISYVQMFKNPIPKSSESSYPTNEVPIQTIVQTGATDNSNIEITSGLKIGDQVITKTTTAGVTSATTQTPSILSAVGGRTGGGGGNFRPGN
ncbi:MAG: HlyD family efflux transporter periplasmic adaptor subunit [bacterium]